MAQAPLQLLNVGTRCLRIGPKPNELVHRLVLNKPSLPALNAGDSGSQERREVSLTH
jgi:hypothetical protein